MGADQIAAIHPALLEVEEAASERRGELCATFEAGSPDLWIQVVPGTFNAAYPHSGDPVKRLQEAGLLFSGTKLRDWKEGQFVTLAYPEIGARRLAILVDCFFTKVLGCDSDEYPVDVELKWL